MIMKLPVLAFLWAVAPLLSSCATGNPSEERFEENSEPIKSGTCTPFKEWSDGSIQFRERCYPDVRDTCDNGECPASVTGCVNVDPSWEYMDWRAENGSRNPKKDFTAPSDGVNSWRVDTYTDASGKINRTCLTVNSKRNWGGGKRGWIAADFVVKTRKPPSS